MRCSLRLLAFLMCIFIMTHEGQAAGDQLNDSTSYRIIISTFESESAGEYTYLTDSIQTMLASRLAASEKIVVLDSALSGKRLASLSKDNASRETIAEQLKADFIISGALFAINSGLNIQVVVHPLTSDQDALRLSIVTDVAKTLLADVEKLADQIRQDAFGQKVAAPVKTALNDNLAGRGGFVTEHPEAAYKKKIYAGAFSSIEGSGVKTSPQGISRSMTVPLEMIGMTTGDLDRDGEEEVLILSQSKIQVLKLTEETLEIVSQLELPAEKRNHAVNIADINGDGVQEIYISATQGLEVSSMILTWQKGDGLRLVADRIPWYLRPVKTPENGLALMGQKRGWKKVEFVQPGIYSLNVDNNYEVTQDKKIALPAELNLFNFSYADLDGDGFSEVVAIDDRERMRVYSSSNELLWVSNRSFGGSSIYIGPRRGDAVNDSDPLGLTVDEEGLRELIFVPKDIIVKDFDQDGSQEIIINENEATFFNFFYKLRIYESSLVVGLHWSGENMQEVWRTGKYRGVIAAYSFASLHESNLDKTLENNEIKNRGRLFLGHIPAKGTLRDFLPGSLDSEIKVYDLEFTRVSPKE